MTSICFIRHGETEANQKGLFAGKTDHSLNENGARQARETAQKLSGQRFDAVFCGNTKRVRETFELIRSAIVFPEDKLYFTDDIREIDFGDWEGLSGPEIEAKYSEAWQAYMAGWTDYTFPGGGANREYFSHCGQFAKNVAGQFKGGRIAIFAHKGFILASVCSLKNRPIEAMFEADIANGSFFLMNMP